MLVAQRLLRPCALVAFLGVVGLTLVAYGTAVARAAHDRGSADFVSYDAAAHIIRDGPRERLYDPTLQLSVERRIVGPEAPNWNAANEYSNPAVYAALLSPIALLSTRSAYGVMLAAESVLLLGCTSLLWSLAQSVPMSRRVALVVGFLGSAFVLQGFFETQTSLLMLASILTSLSLRAHGHGFAAGLALSLLALKPQLIPAFLVLLVLLRSWPTINGFALGTLVIIAASFAIVGFHGMYGQAMLPTHATFGSRLTSTTNQNWIGFVESAAGGNTVLLWIGLPLSLAVIAVLFASSVPAPSAVLHYSAGTVASLVANPHVQAHDLTLLVVPVLALIVVFDRPWLALGCYFAAFALWFAATSTGLSLAALPLLTLGVFLARSHHAARPFEVRREGQT
jgi:Glycosyltransferase family 87